MSIRFEAVCIDTTDPARLAAFWQQAIGWQQTYAKDEDHPEIPEPSSCGLAPLAVTPQAAFAVDGEQECPPERDAAERGVAGCQQHDGCDAEAGE
jgi:glyoxalase superfamily protein